MKFTDGFWKNKNEYNVYSAVEVYDVKEENNKLTLYSTYYKVQNRGQTLWGPMLTVQISSPDDDILCIKIEHFKGMIDKNPKFEINNKNIDVEINKTEDYYEYKTGNLKAKIKTKDNWNISLFNKEEKITGNNWRSTAYITDEKGNSYIREQLDLDIGELVYGLGERFTQFAKNGQVVDIWNADGGTCSEMAYKNIPFYITNKGYGVFVNHSGKVSYEVASENVSRVQFSVPGESMEYYIINGPKLKDVLNKYTNLTGKPALPPAWSFGLWLTTSFITKYDKKTVNNFINGMKDRDIPLKVFHFDCFWMKEYHWTNFLWDSRVFPDPKEMLKELKDKDLKICVWINPYIAQQSEIFDEAVENGFLIKKVNGDTWQCDDWQPGMGIVDFTNPKAKKWYQDKLRVLADMGVDSFKTDFGERIPTEDIVYYDNSDTINMHNYYSYIYNEAVFEVLEEKYGKNEVLVFARSGSVGSQKFPVHWGGDCTATFESMAESIRGGLSLGVSGFGFWSHDIAGFENTATPDLYKRWSAFGLLSSHSRLHGNMSYRVPWLFDEEAVDVLRFFTKLKCKLMPYVFNKAIEASKFGTPVMRPMILEFQDDPSCDYLDRQYMLGDSLLIAPILSEEKIVKYYVPEGRWTKLLTGEKIEGGHWYKEKHDYFSLPLLVKENSIIPIGKNDSEPDYDYFDNLEFNIFELDKEIKIEKQFFDENYKKELKLIINKKTDELSIKIDRENISFLLWNVKKVNKVINGKIEENKNGIKVIPIDISKEIILKY
ncbi:MAG: alpha-xylosidase [Clostridiales bacterium]